MRVLLCISACVCGCGICAQILLWRYVEEVYFPRLLDVAMAMGAVLCVCLLAVIARRHSLLLERIRPERVVLSLVWPAGFVGVAAPFCIKWTLFVCRDVLDDLGDTAGWAEYACVAGVAMPSVLSGALALGSFVIWRDRYKRAKDVVRTGIDTCRDRDTNSERPIASARTRGAGGAD